MSELRGRSTHNFPRTAGGPDAGRSTPREMSALRRIELDETVHHRDELAGAAEPASA